MKMSKNESLKACEIFQRLIKDGDFVEKILKTESGLDIAEMFSSHGVDLSQIGFSELCKILTQKIQSGSKTYEIDSVMNSIVPDYSNGCETTFVSFDEDEKKT